MSVININNSDGSDSWKAEGNLYLNDNDTIVYVVDEDTNTVQVKCKIEDGYQQKYFSQMEEAIKAHSNVDVSPIGSPMSLDYRHYADTEVIINNTPTQTHMLVDSPDNPDGYYVASLNRVLPLNKALDIVSSGTTRWATADSGLSLQDIARPGVDCIDYMQLATYIGVIEKALEWMADQIAGDPDGALGSFNTDLYGLFKQYQALRELWNYLVIRNMVVFNTVYQGENAYVRARITNDFACDIPLGDFTISFTPEEDTLEAVYVRNTVTSKEGLLYNWLCGSATRQPMDGGEWVLQPPSGTVVHPGSYLEVEMKFELSGKLNTGTPPVLKTSKAKNPWADHWPIIVSGKVSRPGHLSEVHTHFNMPDYHGATGMPPTGEGCKLHQSPGQATVAWVNPANCMFRPAIYVSLICKKDGMNAPFTTHWDCHVESDDTSHGTFSLDVQATTVTLMLGSLAILRVTGTNMHWHEGDGLAVELPRNWSEGFAAAVSGGLTVPTNVVWDIPSNPLIPMNTEAGGTKNLNIPSEASSTVTRIKRITLDDQRYTQDSVRTPDYEVDIQEEEET